MSVEKVFPLNYYLWQGNLKRKKLHLWILKSCLE